MPTGEFAEDSWAMMLPSIPSPEVIVKKMCELKITVDTSMSNLNVLFSVINKGNSFE